MGVLRSRLLSFSLILVLAFLLLVSLIVNAALAVVERFWGAMWMGTVFAVVANALSMVFSFAVVALLFGTIFKMLPETRVAWRDVGLGAVVTALLFTLGKHLIGLYLGNSAVASSYGAAGSVVALMLWVYYSAQIFFSVRSSRGSTRCASAAGRPIRRGRPARPRCSIRRWPPAWATACAMAAGSRA